MYTETVGGPSLLEFAQEDDLGADLPDGDVEVPYPRIDFLEVVELMVVGREEGLGSVAIFMDVLDDGPCDGHSVVGRGSAAYLIQKDEGAGGEVVQNHRGLEHLDHEGGFASGNVVRGADSCEYLVEAADVGAGCGNETSNLGEQDDEGSLTQKG